ncbi:MAG TPA: hypothetical protein VFB33_03845 [Candidatus Binataceae bacterium]|jgi:hypothetical protein|nr:hypothetical protein [Candidatus Binataceae bacterium]
MAQMFSAAPQLSAVAAAPVRLFRALLKCRACGHPSDLHVGFADPELARQLSRIHGGCLDCEICADE